MGKSTPDAPDYTAAAERTGESNKEALNQQTWANRINQTNPWGSIEYTPTSVIDPSTGQRVTQWSQNETLTPLAQEALDRTLAINAQKTDFASQMMGRAGDTLLQDTDWSKFGDFGTAPVAYGTRAVQQDPNAAPVAAAAQVPVTQTPPPTPEQLQAGTNAAYNQPNIPAEQLQNLQGTKLGMQEGQTPPFDPSNVGGGAGMEAFNKYRGGGGGNLTSLLGMLRQQQ